jgi:hypothetical protein
VGWSIRDSGLKRLEKNASFGMFPKSVSGTSRFWSSEPERKRERNQVGSHDEQRTSI